jgi:hypothetical protein
LHGPDKLGRKLQHLKDVNLKNWSIPQISNTYFVFNTKCIYHASCLMNWSEVRQLCWNM